MGKRIMSTGEAREKLGLPDSAWDAKGERINLQLPANTYWEVHDALQAAKLDLQVCRTQYKDLSETHNLATKIAEKRKMMVYGLRDEIELQDGIISDYHKLALIAGPLIIAVSVLVTKIFL